MTSSKIGMNSRKKGKNQKGNQEGLPSATETQEAGLVGDEGSPGKPTAEAHGTQLELHSGRHPAHAPMEEDPPKHLGWDPNTRFPEFTVKVRKVVEERGGVEYLEMKQIWEREHNEKISAIQRRNSMYFSRLMTRFKAKHVVISWKRSLRRVRDKHTKKL